MEREKAAQGVPEKGHLPVRQAERAALGLPPSASARTLSLAVFRLSLLRRE